MLIKNKFNNYMLIKNKFNKAFSMIELSIIVIIIGILIAAVSAGQDLYYKSKISAAESITKTFGSLNMPGLKFWINTTMPNSFNGSENAPRDGDTITSWESTDYSGLNGIKSLTANGTPKYVEDGIGGLPSVQFITSATDYFVLNSPEIIESGDKAFSFVVVWKPDFKSPNPGAHYSVIYYGPTSTAGNNEKMIDYWIYSTYDSMAISEHTGGHCATPGQHKIVFSEGTEQYTIASLTPSVTKVYTNLSNPSGDCAGLFDGSLGIGSGIAESSMVFRIGLGHNTYNGGYDGLISELMIFDRPLGTDDVELIRDYFQKKYGLNS